MSASSFAEDSSRGSPLWSQLRQAASSGEHERVVETATKILRALADSEVKSAATKDKDSEDAKNYYSDVAAAQQSKAIALLQLGRARDVVDFCRDCRKTTAATAATNKSQHLAFELAYALYNLKDHDSSSAELQGADGDSVLHLQAQIAFRMGEFQKAAQLYERLRRRNAQDAELHVNLVASYLNAGLLGDAKRVLAECDDMKRDSFELVYNESCVAISSHDWTRAAELLQMAETLCRQLLADEGQSADEIADEVAVMKCQRAFVLHMRGEESAAEAMYTELLKQKPSDVTVGAIASNNLIAIHKQRDLFDSIKRLKSITGDDVTEKLTQRQRAVLNFTHALVLLHANKTKECHELIERLEQEGGEIVVSGRLALVLAALAFKDKEAAKAEGVLTQFVGLHGPTGANDATETDVLRVQLTRAEAAMQRGDTAAALAVLEALTPNQQTPGVISAIVALHRDSVKAEATLKKYCGRLEQQVRDNVISVDAMLSTLRQAASYFMEQGKYESAASIFEQIVELVPNDLQSLPKLITALSYVDFARAESYEARLPSLGHDDEPLTEVELDKLEQAVAPGQRPASKASAAAGAAGDSQNASANATGESAAAASGAKKPKKPRKRKVIYPKGYTAETINTAPTPDPERWIPKRDRESNRRHRNVRKAKQAAAAKGAQGGQSKDNKGGVSTPDQIARQAEQRAAAHEAEMQKAKADRESAAGSTPKYQAQQGQGAKTAPKPKKAAKKTRRR